MSSRTFDPSDPEVRAQHKRWLANWRRVGPILEAERWERLAAMSERTRARMTLDLLGLWQRRVPGDNGEALLRIQRAFAKWRRRA